MGKRIIWPGLLAGLLMLIIGFIVSWIFGLIFPGLMAEYESGIFRAWEDPLMMLYFLYPFVLGVCYAWVWGLSKDKFKGTVWQRGAKFGLFLWIVFSIPGMLITYSSFVVSLLMIISWLVMGLVNGIVAGWIFAKLNK
jgi:membrane protease YdiL (CAAX protease family)